MKEQLRFSQLSTQARTIWAKSGEGAGHGLLAHLLDVAAVTETLLTLEPETTRGWLTGSFGLPQASISRWIAALAGLHDYGKAIPGFQAKWEEGQDADRNAGLPFDRRACDVTNHSCATAALLGAGLQRCSGAETDWVRHVLQAISAHHGYHFLRPEIEQARPDDGRQWADARQAILDAFWSVLAPEGTPVLDELDLPAVNWLAGITSVADWIASNPEWFSLGERQVDLHDYYRNAQELAEGALQRIGWGEMRPLLTGHWSADALLARIVNRQGVSARPLQQSGDRLLGDVRGPALLLVEAPMGEGKTELAFLAHLRLQAANGHRGLYMALPTQATGNAMFKRTLTFLEGFADGPLDVQLVHGGATLNEDVQHLRGVDHSSGASLSASAWFSQRRRPLLSPYGVGTVDQALFSVLNVKHHFVRLWGLSNRVVVLDEVHAYDTYTHGLIESLLCWLKALGSSVVLMSATLPERRRTSLLKAWGIPAGGAPELPYPRVMLADQKGARGEHFEARPLAPIRLAAMGETLEALAARACELLDGGGCGALIVNTVDRAQALYRTLSERLDGSVCLLLFHARFPADERNDRERRVLGLFGPDGQRPEKALLIATQVVEQSLDLDFDFMLSDLAPVDLLLQRAGRLHRHMRERPPMHQGACLHVAGLDGAKLPDLKETAWQYVYDAYILGRTWALLSREQELHLPGDIDRLVQVVYDLDGPLPDDLEEKARQFIEVDTFGEYLAKSGDQRMRSVNIAIDPLAEPQHAYAGKPHGNEEGDGIGLTNRTRLGLESVTLIPVRVGLHGWQVDAGAPCFQPDQPVDDDTARRLYARQFKLSRKAVVAHFRAGEAPLAFTGHALLKHCYPLPLKDGRYELDGLSMRLDEELGLVYEHQQAQEGTL
ncbi:CRISPR-associated helicase Cas3' [Stutzerimonas urumqiensis]|uniref:CRISPR-associated helicase Cas3' n=1 Tax=Stutzerimonas urumqiensis TaxID=638269 RepID=UPI000EABA601|nr:CRISPR-associated helicase Cas3' [Stutzerimonas urumqiensis]